MTSELDTSVTNRLRALRVDPPDDGFLERFSARLEAEPVPLPQGNGAPARSGRRRGIFLLSLAAVFVSGGAFAFLEGAPLSWREAEPPANPKPAATAVARTLDSPEQRATRPRPRAPEATPQAVPEPVDQATPAFRAPALASPLEGEQAGAQRVDLSKDRSRAGLPRDQRLPEVGARRALPTLPSPVHDETRVARGAERPGERIVVPRLNTDLHQVERDQKRPPERTGRPGDDGQKLPRHGIDPDRRREMERTRQDGRFERPDGREDPSREPERAREREPRR